MELAAGLAALVATLLGVVVLLAKRLGKQASRHDDLTRQKDQSEAMRDANADVDRSRGGTVDRLRKGGF